MINWTTSLIVLHVHVALAQSFIWKVVKKNKKSGKDISFTNCFEKVEKILFKVGLVYFLKLELSTSLIVNEQLFVRIFLLTDLICSWLGLDLGLYETHPLHNLVGKKCQTFWCKSGRLKKDLINLIPPTNNSKKTSLSWVVPSSEFELSWVEAQLNWISLKIVLK